MEIKMVEVEKIKPYPTNPRIHNSQQIEELSKAIQKFGFVNPIILNNNYEILAGHARFQASKKLGLKEVPCIFVDFKDAKLEKEFRIVDNKLADMASWDEELLRKELMVLDDVIGFTQEEVQSILKFVEFAPKGVETYIKNKEEHIAEMAEENLALLKTIVCPYCKRQFSLREW